MYRSPKIKYRLRKGIRRADDLKVAHDQLRAEVAAHQRAEHLGATHRQPHKGRASAPFLSTQALVCRGGEQEDGSSTPDKTAWIAWSDEQGLGDIAQAEFAALSGDEFRLVDERGDGA